MESSFHLYVEENSNFVSFVEVPKPKKVKCERSENSKIGNDDTKLVMMT